MNAFIGVVTSLIRGLRPPDPPAGSLAGAPRPAPLPRLTRCRSFALLVRSFYFSKAIDEGAASPTVGLRGSGSGRAPGDLPLQSLRIREEGRPRALTHP